MNVDEKILKGECLKLVAYSMVNRYDIGHPDGKKRLYELARDLYFYLMDQGWLELDWAKDKPKYTENGESIEIKDLG